MTRPRSRRLTPRRQMFLLLAVLGLLAAMTVVSTIKSSRIETAQYEQVAVRLLGATLELRRGAIRAADQQPTPGGVMQLPTADARLSIDGAVYLTGEPAALCLFPTWRGAGSAVVGMLWSERDLSVGEAVQLRLPYTPKQGETTQAGTPPSRIAEARVTHVRGNGWYVVSRDEKP